MNSGPTTAKPPKLIKPRQHIKPWNDKTAQLFVERKLSEAKERSSEPIDISLWKQLLDPEGKACLDKPSGCDMEELRKAYGAFYNHGKNHATVQGAKFNPFSIPSELVICSGLTDSGTGQRLAQQKEFIDTLCEGEAPVIPNAQMFAYAKSVPRKLLDFVVSEVFGKQFHLHPALQGRAAEFLLLRALNSAGILLPGDIVLSNKPFDTTKGHIENISELKGMIWILTRRKIVKCQVVSCTPLTTPERFQSRQTPFLGDMPMDVLMQKFGETRQKVKIILLTATDNGGGGQPVSMENVRKVAEFAHKNGLLLWIDACRIFHNAMYIRLHEEGYKDKGLDDIAREMLSYADVATISFKKMNSPSGGAVLLNRNSELLKGKLNGMRETIRQTTTVMYGNGVDSYCGLTGTGMIDDISGIFAMMDPDVVGSVMWYPELTSSR
jgi:tryptophanase